MNVDEFANAEVPGRLQNRLQRLQLLDSNTLRSLSALVFGTVPGLGASPRRAITAQASLGAKSATEVTQHLALLIASHPERHEMLSGIAFSGNQISGTADLTLALVAAACFAEEGVLKQGVGEGAKKSCWQFDDPEKMAIAAVSGAPQIREVPSLESVSPRL